MSIKNTARSTAKQAVGHLARVDKVKGTLVVTKLHSVRNWSSHVRRIIIEAIPGWKVIKSGATCLVFELVK